MSTVSRGLTANPHLSVPKQQARELLKQVKAKSPIMAFHCGDLDRLRIHLQRDPQLIHRRFTYREVYPRELGYADDLRSGLHGTPIDGTTLLHLSIDFDEREIYFRYQQYRKL